MRTAEDIRKNIAEAFFNNPILGKHYVDWHTENGECGLTLIFKSTNEEFDITIRKKIYNRSCANCGRHDGWNGCGKYVEDCMQDYDVYSNWIPKEY